MTELQKQQLFNVSNQSSVLPGPTCLLFLILPLPFLLLFPSFYSSWSSTSYFCLFFLLLFFLLCLNFLCLFLFFLFFTLLFMISFYPPFSSLLLLGTSSSFSSMKIPFSPMFMQPYHEDFFQSFFFHVIINKNSFLFLYVTR